MRLMVLFALVLSTTLADSTDDLLKQAKVHWKKGEKDKAVEVAGKAIASDTKDARGYLLRGSMREALEQHDEAAVAAASSSSAARSPSRWPISISS